MKEIIELIKSSISLDMENVKLSRNVKTKDFIKFQWLRFINVPISVCFIALTGILLILVWHFIWIPLWIMLK